MGVPMWRVAHLSDIPYVLNTQYLSGDVDNSWPQLEHSKSMSQIISSFVTSGVVGDASWPAAFANVTQEELGDEFPSHIRLKVFGGPYNNVSLGVSKSNSTDEIEFEAVETVRAMRVY